MLGAVENKQPNFLKKNVSKRIPLLQMGKKKSIKKHFNFYLCKEQFLYDRTNACNGWGKIIMVKNFKNKYLNKLDRPYFIAEIGINHNGRLPLALKMIKKAKEAGASAVKFQKRDVEDLLNF